MSKPQLNQCPPTGNSGFAEGFLTGPRHRRTHGTKSFADGRDPRQNHLFAESQPSARIAPSEKERAPSHLGCRPLCRRLRREAVGTDATCAESPLQGSRQRRWPAFNPVDWPLPRASWGRRQITRLCRRPTLGTGSCRGPHQALGKEVIFLVFGLDLFVC
jgi:hypothetical protein